MRLMTTMAPDPPPPPRIMKGFVSKETMDVSVGKWNLKIWVNDQVAVVERRR